MSLSNFRSALLLAALIIMPQVHAEPSYTVRSLGSLGGIESHPTALNNVGQAVGYAVDTDGFWHVFLWQDDVMSAIANGTSWATIGINEAGTILINDGVVTSMFANGAITTLTRKFDGRAINNSGQIVGDYQKAPPNGALYTPGQPMQFFGDPRYSTTGYAINDSGTIVGSVHGLYVTDPPGTPAWRPVSYYGGQLHVLESPDGFGVANAINASGSAVGVTSGGAALWTPDGKLVNLGALFEPGTTSWATGINSLGEVVGGFGPSGSVGPNRGFLYSDGVMYDLNTLLGPEPAFSIGTAFAINDNHQILAETYVDPDQTPHGVFLTLTAQAPRVAEPTKSP